MDDYGKSKVDVLNLIYKELVFVQLVFTRGQSPFYTSLTVVSLKFA